MVCGYYAENKLNCQKQRSEQECAFYVSTSTAHTRENAANEHRIFAAKNEFVEMKQLSLPLYSAHTNVTARCAHAVCTSAYQLWMENSATFRDLFVFSFFFFSSQIFANVVSILCFVSLLLLFFVSFRALRYTLFLFLCLSSSSSCFAFILSHLV